MKHLSRAAPITLEYHRKPRRDRWAHGARIILLAALCATLALIVKGSAGQ